MNACHLAGIGVLLDFVPVHFAVNDYALWHYDGSPLYEYSSSDVGFNQWGSCNFMHSRGEVRSFLQSSAAYWLKEFHFDGLRVDAVRNLLYWQGDDYQEKFAQARLLYLYLFAHPGKKLNFMGNELGIFREWDEGRELDWNLLAYPQHGAFARFFRDLNALYESCPPLFGSDFARDGFAWLEGGSLSPSAFAFLRKHQGQTVFVVCNFDEERLKEEALIIPNGKKSHLAFGQRLEKLWWGKAQNAKNHLSSKGMPAVGCCRVFRTVLEN